MANENSSWGEERIANELLLKIRIRVSPRTVNKYLPPRPRVRPEGDLRWSTFLRLHAQGIIACDFFVAVTATFRLLYVFVFIEHRSRRLVHYNVMAHPSAAWTLQQLREVVGYEDRYRFRLRQFDLRPTFVGIEREVLEAIIRGDPEEIRQAAHRERSSDEADVSTDPSGMWLVQVGERMNVE
jgi:hypothetical protein